MRLLINHLTRMNRSRICVAGLNLDDDDRNVRPITRRELRHSDLACEGGLFDIGAVVQIARFAPKPQPPHIEDVEFRVKWARREHDLPAAEFWRRLRAVAKPMLQEIFGSELKQRNNRHLATDEGHGPCSLGCLLLHQRPRLMIENRNGKDCIRIWLRSKAFEFDLSITDVRLFAADHVTPDVAEVQRISAKLEAAAYDQGAVIACVGLTRAHADWLSNQPPMHWLQVNNLHFADDPYWRLPPVQPADS